MLTCAISQSKNPKITLLIKIRMIGINIKYAFLLTSLSSITNMMLHNNNAKKGKQTFLKYQFTSRLPIITIKIADIKGTKMGVKDNLSKKK